MSSDTRSTTLTWLEAAEYILSSEGPEMHIRDLTDRIMRLNMVNSSCKTSLETLLYRQTHKVNSKFERVPGKMGWFKLKNYLPSQTPPPLINLPILDDDQIFLPKAVVVKPSKRRRTISSSSTSSSCSSSSTGTDSEEDGSMTSNSSSSEDEILYRKKYRYLKSMAKRMILNNVCLANQLEAIQSDIEQIQNEKKYLVDRLLGLESRQTHSVKKPMKKKPPVASSVPHSHPRSGTGTGPKNKRQPVSESATAKQQATPISNKTMPFKPANDISGDDRSSSESENEKKVTKQSNHEKTDQGGSSRKKRVRRVQPVKLNDDGSPVLPIKIGGLQVHNLGKIIWDRPAFHSERYIWPVGFQSTRAYPSMIDPTKRCSYICRIVDGGEAPIFEMASEESPDNPIQATSATACHHSVLKAINEARDKQATNAGSGPEFFGFSHPTIMSLIQDMDGADRCSKYKRADFLMATSRGGKGSNKTPTNTSSAGKTVKKPSTASVDRGKTFYKTVNKREDPSLAPVVVNRQLSSIQRDSSSDTSTSSDESSDEPADLIIDGM